MREHDVPVLQPPSEISAETLPLLQRVTGAYDDGTHPGLVLDLTGVQSITSSGLSHLVVLGRRLNERGGVLVLAGASRSVTRLLRTVGLERVMPLFRTVDEAAAHVRAQGRTAP